DHALDLRRFPPIPRATAQFERKYKGRTAVERVNARAKVFWGVDDGNVVGARRFHAYVGVVMALCVAFATLLAKTARKEGSAGDRRVAPVGKALEEARAGGARGGAPQGADQGERAAAAAAGDSPPEQEEVNTG